MMGELIDPLDRSDQVMNEANKPQEVVLAIRLPAILADRVIQFGIVLIAFMAVAGFIIKSHDYGDHSGTIEAQQAHIASLETVVADLTNHISSQAVEVTGYNTPVLMILSVCMGILISLTAFIIAVMRQ